MYGYRNNESAYIVPGQAICKKGAQREFRGGGGRGGNPKEKGKKKGPKIISLLNKF